jgi:tungstate transport system ATP-binding protein
MKLVASHIGKSYSGRTILNECISVFENTGTSVLMGPNGCGKSTFLRICALLEKPDRGEIVYSDSHEPLRHDIGLKRRITLVLPRTGVFNTTVGKNVAYGLRVRGVPHAGIERRVNEALDFVGLGQKKEQHARTLSSGETQRLGIARALAIEPEVLFLDEPTASIDEKNTEIIENMVLLLREQGRTLVIMTTHDREQAERIGDRLLIMREGKIAEAGPLFHPGRKYP